jgi:hypothetical protein
MSTKVLSVGVELCGPLYDGREVALGRCAFDRTTKTSMDQRITGGGRSPPRLAAALEAKLEQPQISKRLQGEEFVCGNALVRV